MGGATWPNMGRHVAPLQCIKFVVVAGVEPPTSGWTRQWFGRVRATSPPVACFLTIYMRLKLFELQQSLGWRGKGRSLTPAPSPKHDI
jgi:hypothetical protein